MAKGPRGEQRPADVIGCAATVGRLSAGFETEELKEPSGRVQGHAGAKARAENVGEDERKAAARKAAGALWE
jgi:hypothetical protein